MLTYVINTKLKQISKSNHLYHSSATSESSSKSDKQTEASSLSELSLSSPSIPPVSTSPTEIHQQKILQAEHHCNYLVLLYLGVLTLHTNEALMYHFLLARHIAMDQGHGNVDSSNLPSHGKSRQHVEF